MNDDRNDNRESDDEQHKNLSHLLSMEDIDQDLTKDDDGTAGSSSATEPKSNNNIYNKKESCCSSSSSSVKSFCSLMFGRGNIKKETSLEESIKFSLRFCVSVTCASLFTFLFPADNPWTRAVWIYMTAATVAWQPYFDLAAVLSCTRDQSYAVIGAGVLGLGLGILSMTITDIESRDIFLGFVVVIHGFL